MAAPAVHHQVLIEAHADDGSAPPHTPHFRSTGEPTTTSEHEAVSTAPALGIRDPGNEVVGSRRRPECR